MLTELHIQNFAIIDKLDLRFGSGLIILTGETGAGKSIIVDAFGLLAGSKASSEMVRSGENRAIVEAVCVVDLRAELRAQVPGRHVGRGATRLCGMDGDS
jgi:DNA repair protein RecN (Recombination protein N)